MFFVLFRAGLILTGIIFYETLYNYLWGMSWNTFLSISVFIAGSIYAIVERNFIVGLISVAAALLLHGYRNGCRFTGHGSRQTMTF